MSGRMSASARYKQNPDGSYRREDNSGKAEGYDAMTKADLETELESRDLPKTGSKDELIARLQEADNA